MGDAEDFSGIGEGNDILDIHGSTIIVKGAMERYLVSYWTLVFQIGEQKEK